MNMRRCGRYARWFRKEVLLQKGVRKIEQKQYKFNYCRLKERISQMFGMQKEFAKAIMLSEHTTSLKLSGKIEWKQSEIIRVCETLKIEDDEIVKYFFERS